MKSMTFRTEIGLDGTIRLVIPSDLPPGPVDVTVVVQPTPDSAAPAFHPSEKARSGLFLGRARSVVDVDGALDEVDAMWQAKLDVLQSPRSENGENWLECLERIRARREASGHPFRTKEEIDAEIEEMRSEWDDKLDEVYQQRDSEDNINEARS